MNPTTAVVLVLALVSTTKTMTVAPALAHTIFVHGCPITRTSIKLTQIRSTPIVAAVPAILAMATQQRHQIQIMVTTNFQRQPMTVAVVPAVVQAVPVAVVAQINCHKCHCVEHCLHICFQFIWRGLAAFSAIYCDQIDIRL